MESAGEVMEERNKVNQIDLPQTISEIGTPPLPQEEAGIKECGKVEEMDIMA